MLEMQEHLFLDVRLLQTYGGGSETDSTWDRRWLAIEGCFGSMGGTLEVDGYWQKQDILHYLVWFTLYGFHVIAISLMRGSWIVEGFIGTCRFKTLEVYSDLILYHIWITFSTWLLCSLELLIYIFYLSKKNSLEILRKAPKGFLHHGHKHKTKSESQR